MWPIHFGNNTAEHSPDVRISESKPSGRQWKMLKAILEINVSTSSKIMTPNKQKEEKKDKNKTNIKSSLNKGFL